MPELANQADLAHFHLLINHFPTIGMILGLGLLLLSFIRKNDHLKKVSLEVLFLIALATDAGVCQRAGSRRNAERTDGCVGGGESWLTTMPRWRRSS
jgi:hypothetical protein